MVDPPKTVLAVAKNMRTGLMYGYTETGLRRNIQRAIVEAQDGDTIQISPGAIFTTGVGDGSTYLEGACLHVYKSLTITNIPGAGRWSLAPQTIAYLDGRSGIVIREPSQTYSNAGDTVSGNPNKTIVLEGFDFNNWGRNGDDVGIKIRSNRSTGSWSDHHASVTIRNFKVGKLPFYQSASGIAGSSETLTIENGHVYDTGGGINAASGNDHNFYVSARNLTMRGVRGNRTRSAQFPFSQARTMDGHIVKATFNNAIFEECVFDCGPEGDNSITIQAKGGGNLIVRRCVLISGARSQTATGSIVFEKEANNFGGWTYGLEGHSVLIEKNVFINHRPYVAGYDERAMVYCRPPGHAQEVTGIRSFIVRGNIGMSTVPPDKWIKNPPPAFTDTWTTNNNAVPYDPAIMDAGGMTVSTLPAWRRAMTEVDTLYKVSAAPPSQADASIVFPHGGVVPYGYGVGEWGWDIMSGFSSGAIVDVGEFGTMVFGTGGHTRIQNQIMSLTISDDAPKFGWFQQPYFEASEVNGAEMYYNRAEFNALPANRKTGQGGGTEVAMTAAWLAAGGEYPMGYEGWIYPRKLVTGQLGKNHCHGFRFNVPNAIPPEMTGTGAGAYVAVMGPQGPCATSWRPVGASTADWIDPTAIWPSGRRKMPVWCKNVVTGEWTRIAGFQPDYPGYGFIMCNTAVARDQKRLYVSVDVGGGTAAWWFIDFAGGIAGATISGLISPKTELSPNRRSTGAITDGHPEGRHLWYWPDLNNTAGLILQDLDAGTQVRLAIGQGLNIGSSDEPGMQYDAANNRIMLLQNYGNEVLKYRTIPIPQDPYNLSGYVVSPEKTLAIDSSVSRPINPSRFYSKARFHPPLGVVFVPQDRGRMLAFRPS